MASSMVRLYQLNESEGSSKGICAEGSSYFLYLKKCEMREVVVTAFKLIVFS